jgi:hypothetical protein
MRLSNYQGFDVTTSIPVLHRKHPPKQRGGTLRDLACHARQTLNSNIHVSVKHGKEATELMRGVPWPQATLLRTDRVLPRKRFASQDHQNSHSSDNLTAAPLRQAT